MTYLKHEDLNAYHKYKNIPKYNSYKIFQHHTPVVENEK